MVACKTNLLKTAVLATLTTRRFDVNKARYESTSHSHWSNRICVRDGWLSRVRSRQWTDRTLFGTDDPDGHDGDRSGRLGRPHPRESPMGAVDSHSIGDSDNRARLGGRICSLMGSAFDGGSCCHRSHWALTDALGSARTGR